MYRSRFSISGTPCLRGICALLLILAVSTRIEAGEDVLLLALDLKHIPNFKHVIPSLQALEHLCSNGEIYGSPVSQGVYGLAYNSALLKEKPRSWDMLWDPRFKGKYVISANEYTYNASITALALGYPHESISSYDALNNKVFKDKKNRILHNINSKRDRNGLKVLWQEAMKGIPVTKGKSE